MAPNRSAVPRTVNSNTQKIHDQRMSEWTTIMGMHREPLPMAYSRQNQ